MDLADDYQMKKVMPLAENAVQPAAAAVNALNRLVPRWETALGNGESAPGIIAEAQAAAIEALQQELMRIIQLVQMDHRNEQLWGYWKTF